MRTTPCLAALMAIALIGLPAAASSQAKADLGKREYDANCAVCHGTTGRGDGPYSGLLDKNIANLTTLARRNGGVFPFARVYEFIDGTQTVKAHGTREMPIWGRDYRIEAAPRYDDYPFDPDAYVRARILALTEYVNRLQAR